MYQMLPDYVTDLRDMNEAENILTDEQWTDYLNQLYHITFKPGAKDRDKEVVHASAAKKAEAFLKALKLWKEEWDILGPLGRV